MKKLIAMLLVLVMALSMVACGASEPAPTNPPKVDDSIVTPTTPAAPIVSGDPIYIAENAEELTGEITFFTAFAGENGTQALIDEFNTYYPNVKVNFEVYKNNADGNVGLDTAIMAGNKVDVILSFGVNNTADRWENGLLMDITDRLAADNLDLVTEWGSDAYKYNNRVYAFPSGGLSVYVAINMDKWEAANMGEIPTAWTWDEYIAACEKLTERDASGKVVVHGGSDFSSLEYLTFPLRQAKAMNSLYNEEGMSDFDNPIFEQTLQRECDAAASGIWYSKAVYMSDGSRSRNTFLTGVTATTLESILTRYITSVEHDFKIAYAPYPTVEKDQTNYMAGSIPYSFVGIANNTKNPEAAYAFAKFAATYGNKYMFAAGHACTWTGVNPDEILDCVFGSKEEAEKWIDVPSFVECVVASGKPANAEDYIVAYAELQSIYEEYALYALNGEMSVSDAVAQIKQLADEAIEDAK